MLAWSKSSTPHLILSNGLIVNNKSETTAFSPVFDTIGRTLNHRPWHLIGMQLSSCSGNATHGMDPTPTEFGPLSAVANAILVANARTRLADLSVVA